MGRFRELRGLAHNIASSFISFTNREHLYELGHLLRKSSVDHIEVDILKEQLAPDEFQTTAGVRSCKHYKKWFFKELKKLKVDKDDIESVRLKIYISFREKDFKILADCTIKHRNKEYESNAEGFLVE